MQGRIVLQRKNLSRELALGFLNDAMRRLLDKKNNWAGLLGRGIVAIPQAYNTGTITLTQNSAVVTGSGTGWPVSDVVNTTINQAVQPGWQWVTPASMAGINRNTVFYMDASGTPEICPVQDILGAQVNVYYQNAHAANHTATMSSLANLQLNLGSTVPIYSILAVTSATSLTMTTPWGDLTQSGSGYNAILMYTTFASDLKELLTVVDPFQGIPLRLQVSQEELNVIDPNRTATNNPTSIASLGPSPTGTMLFEIYPPQYNAYQLNFLYHKQWPDMRLPGDRPPPFITPSVLIYGALSDAYRSPVPIGPKMEDPWMSQQTADFYEKKFESGYNDLINSDNSLYQSAFTWEFSALYGVGNASFWQMHDPDAMAGNY